MAFTFLGRNCVGRPLDDEFQRRLTDVQTNLQATHAALNPIDEISGLPQPFEAWCGLREDPSCTGGGLHARGRAIDLDLVRNPYIATRTERGGGVEFGGEASGVTLTRTQRAQVVSVYDRAVDFLEQGVQADTGARRAGETTHEVWRRFVSVSDALTSYFAFCFRQAAPGTLLARAPLAFVSGGEPFLDDVSTSPQGMANRVFVDNIPPGERLPRDQATTTLGFWLQDRPDLTAWGDAEFWYFRILLDYELVRIPMIAGQPGPDAPAKTRRPGNGFLTLRQHVVEALCDIGHLRWGACDFGAGENGDMMHFDLGH